MDIVKATKIYNSIYIIALLIRGGYIMSFLVLGVLIVLTVYTAIHLVNAKENI